MSAQADFMDHDGVEESLRGAFVRSLILHAGLLAAVGAWGWWQGSVDTFGAPDAGGAAVGINVFEEIPLPSRGRPNPLANDTKSEIPQPVEPEPVAPPKPEAAPPPEPKPEAVNIDPPKPQPAKAAPPKPTPPKQQAKQQPPTPEKRFRSFKELEENQLTSKSAPALSNPMFSQQAGAGRISTGDNTTLGNRFAGYAQQIRELVSRAWRTGDVDSSITNGPTVIATFELTRNGTARDIRILQRSGIATLDFSVQRAIQDASPFPPLPADYEGNSATVEFQFELRR